MIEKNFVFNLRSIREMKNMNQKDVAEMLNVSIQTISKFERGVITPSLERAVEIAQALEVTLDELVVFKRIQSEISQKYIDEIKEKNSAI